MTTNYLASKFLAKYLVTLEASPSGRSLDATVSTLHKVYTIPMFPNSVIVTDQDIDLTGLSDAQRDYYRTLATHIMELYRSSGMARMVMGFAGQSGSGKSVTVEIMRSLILADNSDLTVCTADIDAFHFPNSKLNTMRDSKGVVLRSIKGRYDTYDVYALQDVLARFKAGEYVAMPRYSRVIHDPVADGVVVEEGPALLLIAGLWLLRDTPDWRAVRAHIDHMFSIEGDHVRMREYSIERHMRGGRSREDAETFYERSDAPNSEEIAERSTEPDERLPFFESLA